MASKQAPDRRSRDKRRGYKADTPSVKLSKFLSYVCRHQARELGLTVHEGGYIAVSDILALPRGRGFSQEDVRRVVAENDKQRFALKDEEEEEGTRYLMIRANQGHTMQVSGLELRPVQSADEVSCVVHGTSLKAWEQIKHQGLSRMKRTHIHFALGLPGSSGVVSGMRTTSQVHIYINIHKALEDGYKFFLSTNNVVLSPGNKQGLLPPHYFSKVIDSSSGKSHDIKQDHMTSNHDHMTHNIIYSD